MLLALTAAARPFVAQPPQPEPVRPRELTGMRIPSVEKYTNRGALDSSDGRSAIQEWVERLPY
jgi:hypothetical protein